MADKELTRFTPLHELLRTHVSLTERIHVLAARRSEAEELIRTKLRRAIWGYDTPRTAHLVDDAESALREDFSGIAEQLGMKSYREVAEWLIKECA